MRIGLTTSKMSGEKDILSQIFRKRAFESSDFFLQNRTSYLGETQKGTMAFGQYEGWIVVNVVRADISQYDSLELATLASQTDTNADY